MPDSDVLQWLQFRSFYALLILLLLVVGLLLALARRHKVRPRPGTRRPSLRVKPRRDRRR